MFTILLIGVKGSYGGKEQTLIIRDPTIFLINLIQVLNTFPDEKWNFVREVRRDIYISETMIRGRVP